MKLKGGYFFKILEVDLSRGESSIRPVDEDFALQYIGGRGFGARLVADNVKNIRSEERRVGKECRSRWSPYH